MIAEWDGYSRNQAAYSNILATGKHDTAEYIHTLSSIFVYYEFSSTRPNSPACQAGNMYSKYVSFCLRRIKRQIPSPSENDTPGRKINIYTQ
jgi:hypothetical protein